MVLDEKYDAEIIFNDHIEGHLIRAFEESRNDDEVGLSLM